MKATYEAPALLNAGSVTTETKSSGSGVEIGGGTHQPLTGRVGFYL